MNAMAVMCIPMKKGSAEQLMANRIDAVRLAIIV